jgi:hypothetical protein
MYFNNNETPIRIAPQVQLTKAVIEMSAPSFPSQRNANYDVTVLDAIDAVVDHYILIIVPTV